MLGNQHMSINSAPVNSCRIVSLMDSQTPFPFHPKWAPRCSGPPCSGPLCSGPLCSGPLCSGPLCPGLLRAPLRFYTSALYSDASVDSGGWAAAAAQEVITHVLKTGNHVCRADVCHKGRIGKLGFCRMLFWHWVRYTRETGEEAARRCKASSKKKKLRRRLTLLCKLLYTASPKPRGAWA